MTTATQERLPSTMNDRSIYSIIDSDEPWKGRMLFTGPDGIRDHRVTVENEHRHIGIGTMSREGTSEIDYLWRAPTTTPHPRPRSSIVGEVGWGLSCMTDWKMARTGRQVVVISDKNAKTDTPIYIRIHGKYVRELYMYRVSWRHLYPSWNNAITELNMYDDPKQNKKAARNYMVYEKLNFLKALLLLANHSDSDKAKK